MWKGTSAVLCSGSELSAGGDIELLIPALDSLDELFKAPSDTLEAVHGLLPQPLHHAGRAVAVSDVVPQRRKATRLAALFHFRELFDIELLIADGAPVVRRVVQGKTRSESSVGTDDQPVLSGAASPVLTHAAHEAFHVLQTRNRIDHLPTLALFVDEPVEKFVHDRKVFRPDIGVVFMEMLKVSLLHHLSFVDVEGDGDAVIVRDGGELFHVVNVSAADVRVEKPGIPLPVLPPHPVFEILTH